MLPDLAGLLKRLRSLADVFEQRVNRVVGTPEMPKQDARQAQPQLLYYTDRSPGASDQDCEEPDFRMRLSLGDQPWPGFIDRAEISVVRPDNSRTKSTILNPKRIWDDEMGCETIDLSELQAPPSVMLPYLMTARSVDIRFNDGSSEYRFSFAVEHARSSPSSIWFSGSRQFGGSTALTTGDQPAGKSEALKGIAIGVSAVAIAVALLHLIVIAVGLLALYLVAAFFCYIFQIQCF